MAESVFASTSRSADGPRRGGQVLQLRDDRDADALRFRLRQRLEDSGRERGRRVRRDRVEQLRRRVVAIGLELDHLLRRGDAVGVLRLRVGERGERGLRDLRELRVDALHAPRRSELEQPPAAARRELGEEFADRLLAFRR